MWRLISSMFNTFIVVRISRGKGDRYQSVCFASVGKIVPNAEKYQANTSHVATHLLEIPAVLSISTTSTLFCPAISLESFL